jgi:cell wall-associated NlpC family hydrolase
MTLAGNRLTVFKRVALVAGTLVALHGCGTSPHSGPSIAGGGYTDLDISPARREVVQHAGRQIGRPYRYGGSDRQGFDCSGLVQYTHRKAGLKVPRTTASQWRQAQLPERKNLLPGDLLFFSIGWRKSRHVGIYEGNGVFIHAPSSGKKVSRASLDNPYWRSRLIAAKSFL